jgi:hypothetical protein
MRKQQVNKTRWIQEQDINTPAAEIVQAAKAAGITITSGQVYTARSEARRKTEPKKAGSRLLAKPAAGSGGSLDQMVRAIVREEIRSYFAQLPG